MHLNQSDAKLTFSKNPDIGPHLSGISCGNWDDAMFQQTQVASLRINNICMLITQLGEQLH